MTFCEFVHEGDERNRQQQTCPTLKENNFHMILRGNVLIGSALQLKSSSIARIVGDRDQFQLESPSDLGGPAPPVHTIGH